MQNVLVTGSKGQLGSEIQLLSRSCKKYKYTFIDIDELDITNFNFLEEFFQENKIDYILNCAAYTAVDNAEEEQEKATLINVTAVKYLAQLCKKHNMFLIHISTDYVFDGTNHKPYVETDPTRTFSHYGKSKLEGEKEIYKYLDKALIIRTSWLYSSFGNNFVKSMIKYGKQGEELNVVFDQVGTPTYAKDLAMAILEIIPQTGKTDKVEIYHYSNEGAISWYDFALEIMELKKIQCKINPIESKDYPLPSPRPHFSVLNKAKIKRDFNIKIPHWKVSLKECLGNLL